MVKLAVQPFNPSMFRENRTILALGKKGSGKSTLLRHLFYLLRDKIDVAIAFTPSVDTQNDLKQSFVRSLVRSEMDLDLIQKIIDHQQRCQQEGKRTRKIFIMADDTTFDRTLFKNKTMRNLFMNGRHYDITFLFASQYIMDTGPDIRSNTDYLFVFRASGTEDQKKLHKHYFGMFDKFSDFRRTFYTCTEKYECMVLDQSVAQNTVRDSVFWFRASADIPKYKLGLPTFRDMHKYAHRHTPSAKPNDNINAADTATNITEVTKEPKRKRRTGRHIEPYHVDVS